MASSVLFLVTISFIIYSMIINTMKAQTQESLQLNITTTMYVTATDIDDDYIFLSTEEIDSSFPVIWIFGMISTGFLGIILIPTMCIHSLYNFYTQKLMKKPARALYIIFFLLYLLQCIGYTFFRVDLILPMGSSINCKFGYYFTTNCVYLSKLILFIIFIFRIDLAFHSSALGYPRKVLIVIVLSYFIITSTLNALWIYVTNDIITFEQAQYLNDTITIGICTSGSDQSKYQGLYTMTLGLLVLFDMAFNILLCVLFVYKLNIVIKMSNKSLSVDAKEFRTSSVRHNHAKDSKLKKIMKKQTILVLLACLTSMLTLGLGGIIRGFSLMLPFDATMNAFCVWLMFTFSDPIWNKIIHTFCCCCYCCFNTEDLLITLHSVGKALSIRERSRSRSQASRDSKLNTPNQIPRPSASPKIVPLPSINEQDIKIDFKNAKHITLQKPNGYQGRFNGNNDNKMNQNKKSEDDIEIVYDKEEVPSVERDNDNDNNNETEIKYDSAAI